MREEVKSRILDRANFLDASASGRMVKVRAFLQAGGNVDVVHK